MPASPDQIPFTISRVLEAPRALVWAAFTDCEHLKHWWGPVGFPVTQCTMDLRVGGSFLYKLESPNGSVMWGKWTFTEVTAPERLANTFHFSDAQGGVTRHPMAPDWPLHMHSTMTLSEQGGRTALTITVVPHQATVSEEQVFAGQHDSLRGGYGGTLGQLETYLKTL